MLLNSKHFNIPDVNKTTELTEFTRLVIYTNALTAEESDFLNKILAATKLEESAIARIDTSQVFFPLKQVISCAKPIHVLSFDCATADLGLQANIPKYKSVHFQNVELICLDDLASISQETPLKKYLWTALKKWFIDV